MADEPPFEEEKDEQNASTEMEEIQNLSKNTQERHSDLSSSRRAARHLGNNVIGLHFVSPDKRRCHCVPEGYELHFSRMGVAYLAKKEDTKAEGEKIDERPASKISLLCTLGTIGRTFGAGIYLYFDFLRFVILQNFILLGLALLNFIPHCIKDGWDVDEWQKNFYVSTYSTDIQIYWYFSVSIAVVVWIMSGPLYAIRVSAYFKFHHKEDNFNYYGPETDVIEANTKVPRCCRGFFILLSYSVFFTILFFTGVLMFFVIILQFSDLSILSAFLVSVALKILNWAGFKLSRLLTHFERHSSYSAKKAHLSMKFVLWRIGLLLMVYLGKYFLQDQIEELYDGIVVIGAGGPEDCTLDLIGDSFLLIYIFEITISNVWEVLYPVGKAVFLHKACHKKWKRPTFNVAEEYLEIIYRQFIIYLGFPIFPMLAALAVISNLVEYYLDKVRLLRIVATPHRLDGSMKGLLVFFLMGTAIASVLAFPIGTVWVLSGFYFGENCPGTIFADPESDG